jgi:hypothetical protein
MSPAEYTAEGDASDISYITTPIDHGTGDDRDVLEQLPFLSE